MSLVVYDPHCPPPRLSMPQTLWPSSRPSDSGVLLTSFLRRMVCITSGICSRCRPTFITSSTTWSCGSKVQKRCVIGRLPDRSNPTCSQPNRYNVCAYNQELEEHLRRLGHCLHVDGDRLSVTFTSIHGNARLPDPKLLALHAACARVVRMSGAAEAIDELERDVEETRVLAFDGSSARLLDHLITPFARIPGVA